MRCGTRSAKPGADPRLGRVGAGARQRLQRVLHWLGLETRLGTPMGRRHARLRRRHLAVRGDGRPGVEAHRLVAVRGPRLFRRPGLRLFAGLCLHDADRPDLRRVFPSSFGPRPVAFRGLPLDAQLRDRGRAESSGEGLERARAIKQMLISPLEMPDRAGKLVVGVLLLRDHRVEPRLLLEHDLLVVLSDDEGLRERLLELALARGLPR
mmetsp:Transcript_106870/g.300464  ORF Transcript_106870/g.300464 Transcript_106870/m.300464 type:complete len:209 (+) Transcript_106870:137-763(+)